jgi:hypothetical protein
VQCPLNLLISIPDVAKISLNNGFWYSIDWHLFVRFLYTYE